MEIGLTRITNNTINIYSELTNENYALKVKRVLISSFDHRCFNSARCLVVGISKFGCQTCQRNFAPIRKYRVKNHVSVASIDIFAPQTRHITLFYCCYRVHVPKNKINFLVIRMHTIH